MFEENGALRASPECCHFSSALSARVLEVCLEKPSLKISVIFVSWHFILAFKFKKVSFLFLLFALCFKIDLELNIRNCWQGNDLLVFFLSHFLLIRKRINQRNHPKYPNQHRFLFQRFLALYPDMLHLSKIMTPTR